MDFYNDFVIFNRCNVSLDSKQSIDVTSPFVCITEASNNPQISGFDSGVSGCHFLFVINRSDKSIVIINDDTETPENQRIHISNDSNISLEPSSYIVTIFDGENYLIKTI